MTAPLQTHSTLFPFALANEVRIAVEPWRLMMRSAVLRRRCRHRTNILVAPGLGASDASTIPIRWYLDRLGHRVEGWKLGVHGSNPISTLRPFKGRLAEFAATVESPVTLVGYSLGGVVAREAARDLPDLVDQVITIGSPIGGMRYTAAPWMFNETRLRYHERLDDRRSRRPIRVPVTTIYSRNDRIVDWTHASDERTPTAVNVEVKSSHLGLGIDPDVWTAVVDAIEMNLEHRQDVGGR